MSKSEAGTNVRHRAPVPISDCALVAAVEEIGDRWTLLILREAFYGVVRFDDIRADLGIPRAMLADRLAKLVESACLEKRPYREAGNRARYAYALTDKGRALSVALIALTHWGEAHVLKSPGPVEIVDAETDRPLHLALLDNKGANVPEYRASMRLR